MSALGHEQTSHHVRVMSVIPLKADIHQSGLHVRLVPEADVYELAKLHQSSGRLIATMDLGGGCSCFYCRKGLHDRVLMHCSCWHQP
jgi:hypothetical protein